MSKRFIVTLMAIIAVLGGIFFLNREEAGAPDNGGDNTVQTSNHTQGEGTAGVTLVEYGDFQCPACGAYYPIVKGVKAKYGDKITFQFRHFPLSQSHPNAFAAHRAAEAAGLQGKFFEMHDLLYERQQAWSAVNNPVDTLNTYAEELGLDVEKFKQDFSSAAVNATINADIRAGQEVGANSTPTFVLNGDKIEELPRDQESFNKLIEDAIAEQSEASNQE